MAGVFNPTLTSDRSNPSYIILEIPPPEVVDTILKYFDDSQEQNRQSEVCHSMVNDHIESESDSGDSLFITQKPVPKVVRSQKRCLSRSTSEPAPTRELEESEDDIESSISQRGSIASSAATSSTYSKRRKWRNPLREYSFPFLGRTCRYKYQRRRRDTYLPLKQKSALYSSAIGGFFKCVQALEESTERTQSYMDESQALSPLSEEEEIWDDDDMKVVQMHLFATPSEKNCPQTWNKSQSPKDKDSTDVKSVRQAPSPRISPKTQERSRPILQRACKLTGVQQCEKVKKKGGIGEGVELPSGQERSEDQDAADPCVTTEIDRTPGLTGVQKVLACPQSSDAMEPSEEKRRDLLSHDDPIGRQEAESVELFQDEDALSQRTDYQPKEKKRRKKDKSSVHVTMNEGQGKDKSQNLSLDSEQSDCVKVVEKSCSLVVPQDSEKGLCVESAGISQIILEGNIDNICLEHEPGVRETHDSLSSSADLINDRVYDGEAHEVKEKKSKKKKKKGVKGGIGEGVELRSGQEGSEDQDAAGPCVTIEIDRTPGLTGVQKVLACPQSSDAMEPSEEKRRDLLSHDDPIGRQEAESVELFQEEDALSQRTDYQPKEKKKKKKHKSAVHVTMNEGQGKDKSQNLSLDSELIDCVGVVEKPRSQALTQDSGIVLSEESALISQRTSVGNIYNICLEHESSADLINDRVYDGEAHEKVKEKKSKKKKKKGDKGGIGEGVELPSGQEGSEDQDAAGPCVTIEIDRTPGLTGVQKVLACPPQSSDAMEPSEEKRRDLLSHDDPIGRQEAESVELFQDEDGAHEKVKEKKRKKKKKKGDKGGIGGIGEGVELPLGQEGSDDQDNQLFQDEDAISQRIDYQPKEKKKKKKDISAVHVTMNEGQGKDKSQNLSLDSELIDCVGVVEKPRSQALTQDSGIVLSEESALISQRTSEGNICLEHEGSADLISDSVYNGEAHEKVKEKKSKKKKKKGGIGEGVELPSGQEGSEDQDAAGPCVTTEIDRTPGLTEEDRLEPSVPQSSDAMEPKEDHDNENAITQRTDYKSKEKKKKKKMKRDKSDHVIMTEGLKKDKSQNLSLDSELMDCATVVKESSSVALPQNSELGSSAGTDAIYQRTLEGNTDEIGAEHSVSQSHNSTLKDDSNSELQNVKMELVSVVPRSPVSNGGGKKRNNKRKTVSEVQDDQNAIELSHDAVAGPPDDDVETQLKKKKKRKKEKRREIVEEHEREKSLNHFESQLVEHSGQVEESGSSTPTLKPGLSLCLGSTEMNQNASESTTAKDSEHLMKSSAPLLVDIMEPRKRHRKKQVLSSNDDSKVGQEGNITQNENLGQLWKKKKKKKREKTSVEEEETNVSKVPQHTEINPQLNDAATYQKTIESSVAQYVEQTTRKKKRKKMMEKSATHLSEDTAAQSDDSVSVQKEEKSMNRAFLVADTVEKDTETFQETSVPTQIQLVPERNGRKCKKIDRPDTFASEMEPVGDGENVLETATESRDMSTEKKRKRKKKYSTLEVTVANDDRDFDKPDTEYQTSVSEAKSCPEAIDTGLRRKRKHKKKDKELETPVIREESAADIEHSQTDEAMVLKKKHKHSCSVIQENAASIVDEGLQSERSILMHSSTVSHRKKKSKLSVSFDPENGHGHSAEIYHDNKGSNKIKFSNVYEINETTGADRVANSSEAPEIPVSNAVEGKKRKSTDNVKPGRKSCAHSVTLTEQSQNCESKCVEIQPHTKKKKKKKKETERNKPSPTLKGPAGDQAEVWISEVTSGDPVLSESNSVPPFETVCPSDHSKKKQHKKDKRRLFDPNQDYLGTDCHVRHDDTLSA